MSVEKEWTSLSGAVKAEKLSNEQKFVLITADKTKNVLTKGMTVSETAEALILAIKHVAMDNANGKLLIDTICDALQKEKADL